jgi:hypothetical protein
MIVQEREYARLLGYPWGTLPEGDVRIQALQAAEWYENRCKPRVYCRSNVAGITAGAAVDRRVAELWQADRVDEAYFLDRYAAAVVEALAAELGACDSPGNGVVPFEAQWTLFETLAPLDPEIEILASGMLKPRNSLLAVIRQRDEKLINPCARCGLAHCSFRRKSA